MADRPFTNSKFQVKILFLTHRMPYPPDRGDRIRSYHLLRHLAVSHDVWLASANDELPSDEARRHLGELCKEVAVYPISKLGRTGRAVLSLALGRSASEGFFWHPGLARLVGEWNRNHQFDAAVCYCSAMFRYTRIATVSNLPVVADLVDVDSQKWDECAAASKFPRRVLHRSESRRVRALENEIAAKAAAVTLVSREEERLYKSITGSADVVAVPNGVDLDFFSPCYESPIDQSSCCFVGVLNYQPNVDGLLWFVKNVWPRVRAAVPTARFLIVGKSPSRVVRQLISTPGIELYADVPDVRPFLRRSTVAVVPLRIARGVQNKVLEAMSMGKAVIATPEALQGICAEHGRDVIAVTNEVEWSEALIDCFADHSAIEDFGGRARSYVEHSHHWGECLQPVDHLLRRAAGIGPRPDDSPIVDEGRLTSESVEHRTAPSRFAEV